ncbi:single-stranded DNA-binding protein [Georgenia sp. Z1491]|uniref:single-stranded DNA-binding protein n=1 Tax=Georgenia sp. Z1491 TaxID=3416707 RepID=UPI003CECAEBC
MSNEINVTVRGNAAADATLRHTESGSPWVTFRLGSTRRKFDQATGSWVDAETQWFNVKVFGRMAPHIGASVKKGTPVLVRGHLLTEMWVDKDGAERTSLVINGDSVALEMSRGVTTYMKVDNGSRDQAGGAAGDAPAGEVTSGGPGSWSVVEHTTTDAESSTAGDVADGVDDEGVADVEEVGPQLEHAYS